MATDFSFDRTLRRPLIVGGIALSALLVLAGCGDREAEASPRVTAVAEVVRQDLRLVAEATGELEPLRKVEVKSKASGEVLETYVEVGDRVEPGTLLARIDPRDVQNSYNQVLADYEVAQERLTVSEAQLRRSENLLASGVITDQEHESRSLDFANARAAFVRAETSVELARLQLQDVTIRSPMTGIVLVKDVEEGQVIQSASGSVSGGTTLVTIANLDVVQVRTLIDETDVGRIQAGMPVNVRVEAYPDRRFTGQVEKIEPQATVQSNVVMFPVIVQLQNADGALKPGMSAEVVVTVAERQNTLTLPNNAIVTFNEMRTAASVLGVPDSRVDLDQSAFQQLTRELAESRGQEVPEQAVMRGGGDAPNLQALREQVARGEISQDSIRALMQAAGAARGGAGAGARGGQAWGGAQQSSGLAARGGDNDMGRPGVVFVRSADGTVSPRAILIGVNDWNNSEVLIGVEEGEEVLLIGGAQLQAQQQERNQQMRARMGGGLPF
ncbi:MAG: efflux RND transporter periplasmic adaptor subunit [Gemmatimonadales bacterium]|nr:MAG: efflux RND transporter periplasmic adaptor subunit [Gemmatimonadales bacterium]